MRTAHTALLALALSPCLAFSQSSLEDYLKLRKQYGISQSASTAALDTFVGDRVIEVQGVVRGAISSGKETTLILVNPDGRDLYLTAPKVPGWMESSNVAARLIIRASRASELSMIESTLVAAWPEGDVAAYEGKLKAAAEAKRIAAAKRTTTVASRGGNGRPPSLPGTIPSMATKSVDAPVFTAETEAMVPKYTSYIKSVNKKLSDAEADQIARAIVGYGVRYGVDPRLVLALVQAESDFRPATTSHKGAMGLGQIMQDEKERFGLSDAYNTDQNLYATVRLLREDIEKYSKTHGDTWDALILSVASYNAGHGAVKKYGYTVPPYKETQNYVRKVIAAYKAFCGIKD